MSLRSTIATPAGKQQYVRRLFATIANRYDVITVLLSYGLDRRWKDRLVRMAGLREQDRVLDLGCGTGDLLFRAAATAQRAVGLDVTFRMLQLAAEKRRTNAGHAARGASTRTSLVTGDMLALPFPSARFTVVTTGYGLRNVPDLECALDEIARVLAPGGRLLSLDFNRPAQPWLRVLYLAYLSVVGSLLGLVLHGDPDTYRYIPESIRNYPGADGVRRLLERRGFVDVRVVLLLGGLMAIHLALKPGLERIDEVGEDVRV
jgi:demethylmenaquinone methyltransferase/2-methoxy-6-polyprenyl-1,4-benzoquinol methylase